MCEDRDHEPSQRKAASTPHQDYYRRRRTYRPFTRPVRVQRLPARPRLRPHVRRRSPPVSPSPCHSEPEPTKSTARPMDLSLATTCSLLGLRFPPPSGPSSWLDRGTASPPPSRSASFVPRQSPAKSSSTSRATARRSARSSCAGTSSCRVTSKIPTRRRARSTADTSTLAIWPCGTRTGRFKFRTG